MEPIACPDCDLLQELPELPPGAKARCPRCACTVATRMNEPIDLPLALTVTDHDITYERGILSKDRTSVALRQVRSVRVAQGFVNRVFDVGTIEVSSTGDKPEFTVKDMPDPHDIRDAIRAAQRAESRGDEIESRMD